MTPEAALHWKILHRKKDGVEEWIDRAVEKLGAVPVLNDVLLPAIAARLLAQQAAGERLDENGLADPGRPQHQQRVV